jgi:SWI/SNF-related matrix-associated actin-dependent regulator of chromatin subfamily A member 5
MISLCECSLNGILSDEMGLGKSVQTISFIAYLKETKNISGPHLVIAPKSTISSWVRELEKWLPSCRVAKILGRK